jgi:hypothetical protein
LNVLVVLLFAVSCAAASNPATPTGLPLAFSFAAVIIAVVAGWFGGELVDRLGVGVDEGANLNAPNKCLLGPVGYLCAVFSFQPSNSFGLYR